MTFPSVPHSAEFQRIANLPRRAPEDLAYLTAALTDILRTPAGSMALRPVQALALRDAGVEGGLFGPIGVGEGKTLISFLLPAVWDSRRPLLLMPGGLIEKTERERWALSQHWRIPSCLRVFSYDLLGRVDAADELENYAPDALICEEGHRLKNKRAAVTRRVARYMHDHPETKVAILSGTVMSNSIRDFAHLMLWALKWGAPMPTSLEEQLEWAEALDTQLFPTRRPGALLEWCPPDFTGPAQVRARHGFRLRMTETPGVVATIGEGEHVDCSIYVRGRRHPVSPKTEQNFDRLRNEWCLPNDSEEDLAVGIWRHAQELALGLCYVWDPEPPEEWLEARRAWNKFARDQISRGRTYDSELHVANACDAGKLDAAALEAWRAVKDTFRPNVVALWYDDSALQACKEWAHRPGLIWTEHNLFAEKLSEYAGLPYYGAGGFTAGGAYIEDAKPGTSAIASIDANREGKNLQTLWHRNLLVCPPASAAWWEQIIARTHRPGQMADQVEVDVLLGCRENWDACQRALEGARAIQDTTGKKQKLLIADVTLPSEREIEAIDTPRWKRGLVTIDQV